MRSMVLTLLALAGCAAPQTVTSPQAPEAETSGWTSTARASDASGALYDDSGRALSSNAITFDAPETDRFATRQIGSTEPPPAPRPPRVGKRDIFLRSARLDNAMRMLAKEGRFNLVVQGDIADHVTLALHAVEPYDAALAIAEANKLSLRYTGGIVIVARPGK